MSVYFRVFQKEVCGLWTFVGEVKAPSYTAAVKLVAQTFAPVRSVEGNSRFLESVDGSLRALQASGPRKAPQ